jgi:signal transduction histidine kinase
MHMTNAAGRGARDAQDKAACENSGEQPMNGTHARRFHPYAFAVGSVVVWTIVWWSLRPLLDNQGVYFVYMIAIASSAYVGGAKPAALSAILSAAIASPLLAEFSSTGRRGLVTDLALFGVEAAAVILLMRKLQQARNQAQVALAEAEAARRRAEEASDAKEQFVARVTHEWRGPVNTIAGWLVQLEHRAGDSDFVRRAAVGMLRAVGTQSRLVSDLLDYSRTSHGKLSIEPERVTIGDPVKQAIEATTAAAASTQLDIRVLQGPGDARVWADPLRLQQVFTNLLENAIKFTPPGGSIRLAFASFDDCIEVSVTDTGVGIAPDALEAIFDPFAQTDERRDTRRGGLGLGLSIAQEIVRLHGGSLSASSSGLGTGSSFFVRLPSAGAHQPAIETFNVSRPLVDDGRAAQRDVAHVASMNTAPR